MICGIRTKEEEGQSKEFGEDGGSDENSGTKIPERTRDYVKKRFFSFLQTFDQKKVNFLTGGEFR